MLLLFVVAQGEQLGGLSGSLSEDRKRKLHQLVLRTICGHKDNKEVSHSLPLFEPLSPLIHDIASVIALEAPVIIFLLLVGAAVGYVEGWTLIDSVYWTAASCYTIGFGDVAPKSRVSRTFCILFLPFSVAVVRGVLARIASLYTDRKRHTTEEAYLQKVLTRCNLRSLALNHDGQVTKSDFVTFMLVAMQKVSDEEIEELHDVFDRLDSGRNGALKVDDLPGTLVKRHTSRSKKVEHV